MKRGVTTRFEQRRTGCQEKSASLRTKESHNSSEAELAAKSISSERSAVPPIRYVCDMKRVGGEQAQVGKIETRKAQGTAVYIRLATAH